MTEAKGKGVPQRGDIDSQFKWDIASVYADDQAWETDLVKAQALADRISGLQGRWGESAPLLLELLKLQDELNILAGKVEVFASMIRDEDTGNSRGQTMADRSQSAMTKISAAISFIEPEILALPQERVQEFIQQEPGLGHYSFYLERLLRRKPHTLSPQEEKLLSMAGEMVLAPYNIFSMLNNADLRFPDVVDEQGEKVELSQGRYVRFLQSKDRRVRAEAFKAMYTTYGTVKNTLAASLSSAVKANIFVARARNFASALEASIHHDNLPVQVYNNVVDTIEKNLAHLHRYVALKKRVLKLDEIHMYDVYAPMVADARADFSYQEGCDLVREFLLPLGAQYLEAFEESLSQGWIDVYENRGKRSGAYSSGSYGTKPFILLNYDNTLNDVSTLAHELGHSIHTWFSHRNQSVTYAGYPIFSAEVASTLNEALLNHHLLKVTQDKRLRLYIINEYLETIRTTVYRQAMFASFERDIYALVERGEALTHEALSAKWLELNKIYFGPQMVVDEDIALEWARIPHFYYNFYVFKYVTGFAAATTLAEKVLEEGEPARDRYLNFLAAGDSDYPLNLLKQAGVDMAAPEPLEKTLAVFARLLDQLEQEL
jgi:oligoendopeptidase F